MNPHNVQKLTDELTALLHRDVLEAIAAPLFRRDGERPVILVTNAPESEDPEGATSINLPATWAWFSLPIYERGRSFRRESPRRQVRIVALPFRHVLRHGFPDLHASQSTSRYAEVFRDSLPQLIADGEIKRLGRAARAA